MRTFSLWLFAKHVGIKVNTNKRKAFCTPGIIKLCTRLAVSEWHQASPRKYRLSSKMLSRRRIWGCQLMEKLIISYQHALVAQKQTLFWGASKSVTSSTREVILPLCSHETHLESCPSSGVLNTRSTWNCWSKSRGDHKDPIYLSSPYGDRLKHLGWRFGQ